MSVSPVLAFLEGPELLIIGAIILVLFGGAKLPQLARSLGSAQREFKKGLSGEEEKSKASNNQNSNAQNSVDEKSDGA